MPLALTPRLLRRGLDLFGVISAIGVLLVLVLFGENLQGFLSGLANLRWGWMLLGLGLASMDWIGGGTRSSPWMRVRGRGASIPNAGSRDRRGTPAGSRRRAPGRGGPRWPR